MMLPPLRLNVPLVGFTETIVSVSPSGSLSLASTGIVMATLRAVLVVSFTATGGRLVMLVTTGELVLFVGVLSSVGPPTVARFVNAARDAACTVSVKFVVAFAVSAPRFVQMTWFAAFVVVAGSELAKTIPAGKLSVMLKSAAADGPRFVTEIV